MDLVRYKRKVKSVVDRLVYMYDVVGGSFLFFSVHGTQYRYLCANGTLQYLHALTEHGSSDIEEFFHLSMQPHIPGYRGTVNMWMASSPDDVWVRVGPRNLIDRRRRAYELTRQIRYLQRRIEHLEEEGLPYVLYYRPPEVRGVNGQRQPSTVRFYPRNHGETLLRSQGWNSMIRIANTIDLPDAPLLPRTVTRHHSSQPVAGNQNSSQPLPAANYVANVLDEGIDYDIPAVYDYADENLIHEDPLQRLYRMLADTGDIAPTVVYKSADKLHVVLPGLVQSDADRASRKPVLVRCGNVTFGRSLSEP